MTNSTSCSTWVPARACIETSGRTSSTQTPESFCRLYGLDIWHMLPGGNDGRPIHAKHDAGHRSGGLKDWADKELPLEGSAWVKEKSLRPNNRARCGLQRRMAPDGMNRRLAHLRHANTTRATAMLSMYGPRDSHCLSAALRAGTESGRRTPELSQDEPDGQRGAFRCRKSHTQRTTARPLDPEKGTPAANLLQILRTFFTHTPSHYLCTHH